MSFFLTMGIKVPFILADVAVKMRFAQCLLCFGPREITVGFRAENENPSVNKHDHFSKKGKGAWGDALTSRLGKETLRDETNRRRQETGTAPVITSSILRANPFREPTQNLHTRDFTHKFQQNRQEILEKHAKMSSAPVIWCVRALRVLMCP